MTKETIGGLPEELQKLVAGMKRRSYDESRNKCEEQFVKKYEKIEGITR